MGALEETFFILTHNIGIVLVADYKVVTVDIAELILFDQFKVLGELLKVPLWIKGRNNLLETDLSATVELLLNNSLIRLIPFDLVPNLEPILSTLILRVVQK